MMFRSSAAEVSVMGFVLENMLKGFDVRISPQLLCQNETLQVRLDHLRLEKNKIKSMFIRLSSYTCTRVGNL